VKARHRGSERRWHPAGLVPLALLAAITIGTGLLMLPPATSASPNAPLLTALFTATSAITATGMAITSTPEYWSTFGHVIILLLTQIGGLGIMTMATLLVLLVSQQLGLRNRLLLGTESVGLTTVGNAPGVILRVAAIAFACEGVLAVLVTVRLWGSYDLTFPDALWYGLFHAVQAFNNCGFSLFPSDIKPYAYDPWITLPLTFGVIIGATGFPVLFELLSRWRRPSHWSIHARLTVYGSLILLLVGTGVVLLVEWANPRTLGALAIPEKLLTAFVQAAVPRGGGFAIADYGAFHDESFGVVIALMFIGGGTASTSGGIKVTTFFLLAYVILAELRGEPDVVIGRRRIAPASQRLALTVALLAVAAVAIGTLLMLALTPASLRSSRVLFEVTAAFSTAGLSTGLTPTLPETGQALLVLLMFLGRVVSIAAASTLALNTLTRRYRYPEERPLVG
jgi:trk system potassium uptake protein TrkH